MSENLKRAESLFNRIMNQNGAISKDKGGGGNGGSSGSSSGGGSSGKGTGKGGSGNTNQHGKNGNSHNNHSIYSHYSSHNNHSHHNSNNHGGSGSGGGGNGSGSGGGGHGHGYHPNKGHKLYNRGSNYHGAGSSHGVPSHGSSGLELPRLNPIKISEETLSKIPEDHHKLLYCWTMWHHSRSRGKPKDASVESAGHEASTEDASGPGNAAVDSYLQTTKEIEFAELGECNPGEHFSKSMGSIEQVWACLSSIRKAFDLPIGTELLAFKSGINPVWEDPVNTKGGRWIFRFNRRLNMSNGLSLAKVRQRTALIWERLLLRTLAGSIIPPEDYSEEIRQLLLSDISGLVLSVRKDDDIISIWNSNLNFNKKKQSDEPQSKKLSSFQARRIICDAILRVIRECDAILVGSDSVTTLDSGSNERVFGVTFEYRLHSDNNPSTADSKFRRYKLYYKPDPSYVNV